MHRYWSVVSLVLMVGCGSSEPAGSPGITGSGGASSAGGSSGSSAGSSAGSGNTGAVSSPGMTIIQEDELGFSAVDGMVLPRQGSTSITGYTGSGFADGDPGIGKTISWAVKAEAAGTYPLLWRYAFGGTETNIRDATLLVNGMVAAANVVFPYTGTWNDWQESAPLDVALEAGPNFIQLEAVASSGLANIDYFEIIGEGITPDTPSFSLSVGLNDPLAGTVSYSPVQDFYAAGTVVTLHAEANPGYFFQSFTGAVTSAVNDFSFPITANTDVAAIFLPDGTTQAPNLVGYAAVQDDSGTPYLVTGGSLGESVTATTLEELRTYLESPEPYVVSFSGLFTGAEDIQVASNKTLLGIGDSAHLQGIELEINGSRNVIIQNIAVSHVIADGTSEANDAIVITGGAKNIWIDHCELYSDLTHGKDYYDGLLEIKNQSSFVTVSWCVFHDHYKVSLISSGEEQIGDSVIRATYHHNYFHDCGSRLPSIRFGQAHIFDNYYQDNDSGSCVNSRMGAIVKVENNYFLNSQDTIGFWDSPMTGYWDVAGNIFEACSGAQPTESTGTLTLPYAYTLDATADVPGLVVAGAGVGKL